MRLPFEYLTSPDPVTDDFELPDRLCDLPPITHDRLPANHAHRLVALVERSAGNLQLCEMLPVGTTSRVARMAALLPNGNDLLGTVLNLDEGHGQPTWHAVIATHFDEATNWHVRHGDWEVWKILNLTGDTHPSHVHLVQFQALSRVEWDTSAWNPDMGMSSGVLKAAASKPWTPTSSGCRGWQACQAWEAPAVPEVDVPGARPATTTIAADDPPRARGIFEHCSATCWRPRG